MHNGIVELGVRHPHPLGLVPRDNCDGKCSDYDRRQHNRQPDVTQQPECHPTEQTADQQDSRYSAGDQQCVPQAHRVPHRRFRISVLQKIRVEQPLIGKGFAEQLRQVDVGKTPRD